jgi:hypothetical protein
MAQSLDVSNEHPPGFAIQATDLNRERLLARAVHARSTRKVQ